MKRGQGGGNSGQQCRNTGAHGCGSTGDDKKEDETSAESTSASEMQDVHDAFVASRTTACNGKCLSTHERLAARGVSIVTMHRCIHHWRITSVTPAALC